MQNLYRRKRLLSQIILRQPMHNIRSHQYNLIVLFALAGLLAFLVGKTLAANTPYGTDFLTGKASSSGPNSPTPEPDTTSPNPRLCLEAFERFQRAFDTCPQQDLCEQSQCLLSVWMDATQACCASDDPSDRVACEFLRNQPGILGICLNCGCKDGETRCADGTCKADCTANNGLQRCLDSKRKPGSPNGHCELGEGCACEDCQPTLVPDELEPGKKKIIRSPDSCSYPFSCGSDGQCGLESILCAKSKSIAQGKCDALKAACGPNCNQPTNPDINCEELRTEQEAARQEYNSLCGASYGQLAPCCP